jgi:hypothetical protein
MLLGLDAASLKLIMKIGSLPDACRAPDRTPGGNLEDALPDALEYALDPGFHDVPAGPEHPDYEANGAGVT